MRGGSGVGGVERITGTRTIRSKYKGLRRFEGYECKKVESTVVEKKEKEKK